MASHVVIIDYGVGNLTSVRNAIARLTPSVDISADPQALNSATHIILPGVGSFGEGMKGLSERGFIPATREVLVKRKPIK